MAVKMFRAWPAVASGTLLLAGGCALGLTPWTPEAAELVGTWTAPGCDAELVLAEDGTATARHLVFGYDEVADGTGTWTLRDDSSAAGHGLYIDIDHDTVRLDLYRRVGEETLLDILRDPDEGAACNFVRSTQGEGSA